MNGLDLFSGIGGITKALEGYVEPVAYCEIDRYCQAVLLSRMATGDLPLAPIWDDIKTLTASEIPPVDIIYGGLPCQDISCAGRGVGLEGERSGLFFEIIRLAQEIQPSFIFLENVPAIRTRGLGVILKALAALRYDCRWGMLSASDVGANHKRQRWFLLAYSQSDGCGRQRPERERQQRITSPVDAGNDMADTNCKSKRRLFGRTESEQSCVGASNQPVSGNNWWAIEPNVGRVAHGVPRRVDRLRALGNAVVPAQAREAFERLLGLK